MNKDNVPTQGISCPFVFRNNVLLAQTDPSTGGLLITTKDGKPLDTDKLVGGPLDEKGKDDLNKLAAAVLNVVKQGQEEASSTDAKSNNDIVIKNAVCPFVYWNNLLLVKMDPNTGGPLITMKDGSPLDTGKLIGGPLDEERKKALDELAAGVLKVFWRDNRQQEVTISFSKATAKVVAANAKTKKALTRERVIGIKFVDGSKVVAQLSDANIRAVAGQEFSFTIEQEKPLQYYSEHGVARNDPVYYERVTAHVYYLCIQAGLASVSEPYRKRVHRSGAGKGGYRMEWFAKVGLLDNLEVPAVL